MSWEVVCFDAVADDDQRSNGGGELQEVARYPARGELDARNLYYRLLEKHDSVVIELDGEEWPEEEWRG